MDGRLRTIGVVTSGSVSFDRAAAFYDRTRSMSAEARAEVTRLLASRLADTGAALEIGVGTGRIALPLAEAGVEMAGADLSAAMLAELVAKAGGAAPFPIAVADATALPFADGVFGAALACHVLHLVPGWRTVLGELARVVRGGGMVLVDVGGEEGPLAEVRDRFAAEAGMTR